MKEVRLRVGALAAVVEDRCSSATGLRPRARRWRARELVVKILPVVVHCDRCDADVELESVQSFRCPRCGELVRRFAPGARVGD